MGERKLKINPLNAHHKLRRGNCWYYFDNNYKNHRNNDMPAVDCDNGTQKWYKHGKLHRENGKPASIIRKKNSTEYAFLKDNQRYYDDNTPTNIVTFKNGNIKRVSWYNNTYQFRSDENKPARINFFKDGSIKKIEFVDENNKYHKKNGCAYINIISGRVRCHFKRHGKTIEWISKRIDDIKEENPEVWEQLQPVNYELPNVKKLKKEWIRN